MSDLLNAMPVLGYLFIFFARVCDVSLDVFRMLILTRGYALAAGFIGFIEIVIYIVALGVVMQGGLTDPVKIIFYAAGFAAGNLVGAFIEKRAALGYIVIQIFPPPYQSVALLEKLRQANFGVTIISGEGASGPREILFVTAKRKNQKEILKLMNNVDPETFFHISDVRSLNGGVFPNK